MLITVCCISFFSAFHNIRHSKIFLAQKQICLNKIINGDIETQKFYDETKCLFANIPTEERNQIWNFNIGFSKGIYFSMFYHNDIIQCNKIPLYEMAFVDQKLAEEDNIVEEKPLWVILTHIEDNTSSIAGKSIGCLCDYFQPGYEFIESNYSQIARTDTTICDIELWRRKDTIVVNDEI